MFVVIFRATIAALDGEYGASASRLRELALSEFGCLGFEAFTEGDREVALSWWPDEEAIRRWREHPEHAEARRLGRERWYSAFSVEVAEVKRSSCARDKPPQGV